VQKGAWNTPSNEISRQTSGATDENDARKIQERVVLVQVHVSSRTHGPTERTALYHGKNERYAFSSARNHHFSMRF